MRKAQALIEILIAVGVAVIALLSISRISSRSVFNTGSAARQSAATSYATTAINQLKGQIASEGLSAKTNPLYAGPSWCFSGSLVTTTNGTGFCNISGTEFEGQVRLTRAIIPPNSKDELTIVAEIRWQEAGFTRSVKNEAKIVLDQ